jgi:virginiamycin B lyase
MNRQHALACAVFILGTPVAAQITLPDGPGKELVSKNCGTCHAMSRVTEAGYAPEGWRNNIHSMMNVGAKVPAGEIDAMVAYLAKNFPEKPRPAAVVVPGDAKVSIREWFVPTAGSRPHDPLPTADGALWYTGQFNNVLGRLDPRTGTFREFPLKTAQSGPHGLTADRNGNIWFTANSKGYIGKLDPATGAVTEYPMPDPAARDPHTPIFDRDGILWFTVQSGNFVGRLDPKSGEVKLVASPTPRSRPYGILVNSKNVPFWVDFGTNKVASIDRDTLAIREYALPDPASRPRRIAITPDDAVWYTDYARGYLGRLNPATGLVDEWPSPGGPKSQPYGMLNDGDVIWYSESGVKPNTLVRFDPRTQKFQSWIIPSGGGVVRHMVRAPDGKFALALSGVNGVALVEKQ